MVAAPALASRASPHIAPAASATEKKSVTKRGADGPREARALRRPDGEEAGEQQERKEAKRVDAEDRRRLHHGKGCCEPVSHEVPGQPGQHVAAGELGEAEGDCHRENPCRAWAPQDRGKRRSGGIEQSHAAGEPRHGEGDEPAVPPGLDQKGFGGPIKTGEEIAEAEPESDKRGAAEPRAKRLRGRRGSRRAARRAGRSSRTAPARHAAGQRRARRWRPRRPRAKRASTPSASRPNRLPLARALKALSCSRALAFRWASLCALAPCGCAAS